MADFYTILTAVGRAKIANSQVTDSKINLSEMAVGDGGGDYYNPNDSQEKLRNEVWRDNIGSVEVDSDNPNWIVIEAIIPAEDGGFTVREVGIFDASNDLIAIGKYPETYKPVLDEGSAKDLYVRMIIEVSNASSVTLKIDPAVTIASRKYVDEKFNQMAGSVEEIQKGDVTIPALKTDDKTIAGSINEVSETTEKNKKRLSQHESDSKKHISPNEREIWNAKETPSDAQAKAGKALSDAKDYTDSQINEIPKVDLTPVENKIKDHKDDKSNPHKTSKEQVGLSEVDNVKQASKKEFDDLDEKVTTHLADNMYQIPTIEGTQIRINRLSNTDRLFFKLDADLTGDITISTDSGATDKPLLDIEENQVTQLEKGFVEVVADADFFILRNRGISAADRQALIDIVNEAERNESDLKTQFIDAVNEVDTDGGISLPTNATWAEVLANVPNIKTGKKWMSGDTSGSGDGNVSVTTGFTPETVIVLFKQNTSTYPRIGALAKTTNLTEFSPYNSLRFGASIDNGSNQSVVNLDSFTFTTDGFSITPSDGNAGYLRDAELRWIAFE